MHITDTSTMMMTVEALEYLESVRKYADSLGEEVRQDLENNLKYLVEYNCHDNVRRTQCMLYKDFAPHSFSIVMYRVERDYVLYTQKCPHCENTWDSEQVYDKCLYCKLPPETVGSKVVHCPRSAWFNGGLIYYGPMETGVGASQFSVTISPKDKPHWTINT